MASTALTLDAAFVEKCKSVGDAEAYAEANKKDADEEERYYEPGYITWQERSGEVRLLEEENVNSHREVLTINHQSSQF